MLGLPGRPCWRSHRWSGIPAVAGVASLVEAVVASLVDLAGDVTVGVTSLADVGVASLAIAGVASLEPFNSVVCTLRPDGPGSPGDEDSPPRNSVVRTSGLNGPGDPASVHCVSQRCCSYTRAQIR